jgi:hypothetical protein
VRSLLVLSVIFGCSRALYLPEATADLGAPVDLAQAVDLSAVDLAQRADLSASDSAIAPDLAQAPDLGSAHCAGSGGTMLWARRFGDAGFNFAPYLSATNGYYVFSGSFEKQITFPPTPTTPTIDGATFGDFAIAIDDQGQAVSGMAEGVSIVTDLAHREVLAWYDGATRLVLKSGVSPFSSSIPLAAVNRSVGAIDGLGRYILAGTTSEKQTVDFGGGPQPTGDFGSLFIAVWNSDFSLARAQLFPLAARPSLDAVQSIAGDATGNLYLAGSVQASGGIGDGVALEAGQSFFAKYDPSGTLLWSRSDDSFFHDVVIGPSGELLHARNLINGAGVTFVLEGIDGDAAPKWNWSFDAAKVITSGLAVGPKGEIVWMGHVAGTVDFGGGPLSQVAPEDTALVKLDSAQRHLWSKRTAMASRPYGSLPFTPNQQVAITPDGTIVVTGVVHGDFDVCGVPAPPDPKRDVDEIVIAAFGE